MSAEFLPRSDAMRAGLATMGIVLASIGFGLVPFFARALTAEGMAPHAVAFFRYAIAATTCCCHLSGRRGAMADPLRGGWSPARHGLGWIGYVRAVEVAPVSTVGVLYMTYPVFTLLIAWLVFGDRPGRRAIIAAVMIIAAADWPRRPRRCRQSICRHSGCRLRRRWGSVSASMCWCTSWCAQPLARIASCVSLGSVLGLLPLLAQRRWGRVSCQCDRLVAGGGDCTRLGAGPAIALHGLRTGDRHRPHLDCRKCRAADHVSGRAGSPLPSRWARCNGWPAPSSLRQLCSRRAARSGASRRMSDAESGPNRRQLTVMDLPRSRSGRRSCCALQHSNLLSP
jgi:uncharacterized membrane protein